MHGAVACPELVEIGIIFFVKGLQLDFYLKFAILLPTGATEKHSPADEFPVFPVRPQPSLAGSQMRKLSG